MTLKDNRAADPGPAGWSLVWNDEFDDPAARRPTRANWTHEIGDVTPDGKNGWGQRGVAVLHRQHRQRAPPTATATWSSASKEADGSLTLLLLARASTPRRACS